MVRGRQSVLDDLRNAQLRWLTVRMQRKAKKAMSDGRVAVVTGGTRGIGRAISEALKTQRAIKWPRPIAAMTRLPENFPRKPGSNAINLMLAILTRANPPWLKSVKDLGPVAVLVNNAGITRDGTMHRMNSRQMASGDRHQFGGVFQYVPGGD